MSDKVCTKCQILQPLMEFYKVKKHKDGLAYQCKTCSKKSAKLWQKKNWNKKQEMNREWRKRNPSDQWKNSQLLLKYGITIEQYNQLKMKQDGKCFLCDLSENDQKKSLEVDHCHKTGIVRGLLCHKCNKALGLFNDNINLLKKAIKYLAMKQNKE